MRQRAETRPTSMTDLPGTRTRVAATGAPLARLQRRRDGPAAPGQRPNAPASALLLARRRI